ncbi:cytochrome P450 [Aspergillus pseudoustus]|uniref:Cytochrome P450 n=1 Tax=Aspergillus pseudoustus TaxID=1810923 RepID=A0ABR4KIB7_9EURO
MPSVIIVAISAYAAYILGLGVPGPKHAVLSRWHERYYDDYLGGKFIFWIEEQHRKYGPVVHITPDELHFLDADLWETVVTKTGRVDKYDWLSGRFCNDTSVLTTAPDSLHRVRRGALNPLFSRQRIVALQDVIRKKLNILIKRLENAKAVRAPVAIQRGFGAFSEDVIMQYSFGHDYDSLKKEECAPILNDSFRFQRRRVTVFSELIEGDLPDAERADRRLQDEAQLVIAAGLATTTWALSVGTFYLLRNPNVLARLRLELDEAIPDYDPVNPTANLDREAVRLSYSTTSRNVRLQPKPFEFNEWTIPAQTPEIFPNSRSFVPERWLGSPRTKNGSPLERYFVGFGKGTRSCLGLKCELYLVFACLFRGFDLELFETDITDVELAHDFFIPFSKLDSKGVRVFVKPRK